MLKPNAKAVEHQPYTLNLRVKEKVKKNREDASSWIIFLVDEAEWVILIVI